MFTSRTNTLTGQAEWEIQNEDYDYQQELARAGFADMLHDYERNQKYYDGLKKIIKKLKAENKRVNVLDIGTGTGLLSMMAVQCGADTVTACEAFKPMVQVAKNCIKANGMQDKITIIEKRSTEIQMGVDMNERANVLVTEVFDTELIGEGAISTFKHALENLLTEDCYVIPDNAVMYVQVVESPVCYDWNWLNLDPKFNVKVPSEYVNLAGESILDLQLTQFSQFKPLTPPVETFKFSFSGKEPKLVFDNEINVETKAIENGKTHAIFMWWILRMDYENEILLSCAPKWAHHDPNKMQWRDHWMQAIYYPQQVLNLTKNETFIINCNHDEYSLWFDVTTSPIKHDLAHSDRSLGATIVSRNRLGQLNDTKRTDMFYSILKKHQGNDACVLIANDDFSVLPFIAAQMNFKQVYVLEINKIRKRCLESFISENNLANKLTILEKPFHELTQADYDSAKFNVLLSELAFSQALLPWENLYFYYGCKNVTSFTDSNEIKFLPQRITIKAIAVEYENLDKIRSPVNSCEGFNIAEFDKVILEASKNSDGFQEPHPLWEYPCKPLSQVHEIFGFEFNPKTLRKNSQTREIEMPLVFEGLLNGVALWQEIKYDDDNELNCGLLDSPQQNENLVWSMNYKQAVHLLDKKYSINHNNKANTSVKCSVKFDIGLGKFNVDFKIKELN